MTGRNSLREHTDVRAQLATNTTLEKMEQSVAELKSRFIQFGNGEPYTGEVKVDEDGIRKYPGWVLQPYVRSKIPPNPEKIKESEELPDDKENVEKKDLSTQVEEEDCKVEKRRGSSEPDRKPLSKKRKPFLDNYPDKFK